MKPAIKTQLVAALRSGNYKQAKGALKRQGTDGVTRHCCLGVLSELYVNEVKPVEGWMRTSKGPNGVTHGFGRRNDHGMPSKGCLRWAGLSRGEAGSLAEMNDARQSFEVIAKHIEKDL